METVKQVIKKLEQVPIDWDRYTENEGYYVLYGWINRRDGQRDFIMIATEGAGPIDEVFFATSSAKHSAEICDLIYGAAGDHNPCRKIEELLAFM